MSFSESVFGVGAVVCGVEEVMLEEEGGRGLLVEGVEVEGVGVQRRE